MLPGPGALAAFRRGRSVRAGASQARPFGSVGSRRRRSLHDDAAVLRVSSAGSVTLPATTIPAPAGLAAVSLAVPAVPALVGLPLYAQALVTDPTTGAGWFTNAASATIRN